MNCAPGGRAATSEIAIEPSGRRNHSMCVIPVTMPSVLSARGPASRIAAYSGPSIERGSSTDHCSHGVSITSSGVGA